MTDTTTIKPGENALTTGVLCKIVTGSNLEPLVTSLKAYNELYIVADRNVKGIAWHISEELRSVGGEIPTLFVDAGEHNKNMDTVLSICKWLMTLRASRQAAVLAIGGGITTDMAGFAAAIYKRGIRCIYLPTTMLAQVDAAVGGKNGINLDSYKNILGVIRQPEFTYVCPEVLATLPYRDFLSGSAEMLKTFIIDNRGESYGKAVSILSEISTAKDKSKAIISKSSELQKLIAEAATIKAGIVSRDEFESGERRKLNLGHTFAHAIEHEAQKHKRRGDDISHGEAVSIGIILAAMLSEKYYEKEGLAARLRQDFAACGLSVDCPYPVHALSAAMLNDKKADNKGLVDFVLINAIGDVRVGKMSVSSVAMMLSTEIRKLSRRK